jgi:inner membrane transporter RhtA
VLGPAGVVAVRQWVAGVALLAIGRPRLRSFTWRQWRPVLALALVFATMNLSLYTAIDRIGLGLAVTLEFLGPLSVALARPQPTTDYLGIALGLLAAACWASYILLNRVIGHRLPGAEGSAASAVPFLADLFALRRVPARFFGVFMSVNPVPAALIGLVILGQSLGWAEWLAIVAIVTANTVSVLTAGQRRSPSG